MKLKSLLLASISPRRAELLAKLKIPFQICAAQVRELSGKQGRHLTPAEMALCNAWRKARAVARKHPGRTVLAADTIVALDDHVLGKPRHRREAAAFLRRLSGRTHQALTAVVLIRPHDPQKLLMFVERSDVSFHRLSSDFIRRYLAAVPVLDKAGAYACQETKFRLIKKIKGLRSNVIGLPVERLRKSLFRRL